MFFLNVYLHVSVYMSMCTGSRSAGTGLAQAFATLHKHWELNSDPLQKKQVLLSTASTPSSASSLYIGLSPISYFPLLAICTPQYLSHSDFR